MSISSASTNLPPPPPSFRSVTATRRPSTFTLKVIKAKMTKGRSKSSIDTSLVMHVELTEAKATLGYIQSEIQKRWGPSYTLVTVDGAELDDSPATTGNLCL